MGNLRIKNPIDEKIAEKCQNSSLYIPKSTDHLEKIMAKINIQQYKQPIRIWTDFKRLNNTHFWSETGKFWWSTVDVQGPGGLNYRMAFKDSVVFNGYGKLKNFLSSDIGNCICVVNQQLKWQVKCLILFFVASFVIASAGINLGLHFQN